MKIAYVLYPDFTALDLIGPYEVISRWPDAEVHFLARSLEPVRCDQGLTVIPTDTPATLPDPESEMSQDFERPSSRLVGSGCERSECRQVREDRQSRWRSRP